MMTRQELVDFMKQTVDRNDWRARCDYVKRHHGNQYPDFWYEEIIRSGLMDEILGEGASDLRVIAFDKEGNREEIAKLRQVKK
jgi:hypothetical protein